MPRRQSEFARLTIDLPAETGKRFNAKQAPDARTFMRGVIAAQEHDPRIAIPAEFWHHTPDTGATLDRMPMLRPFAYPSSQNGSVIGYEAIGEEAVDMLQKCGHRLVRALSRVYDRPFRERWISGAVRIQAHATRLHRYVIPSCVFAMDVTRDKRWGQASHMIEAVRANHVDHPEVHALTDRAIRRSLQRQADVLDLDVDLDDALIRIEGINHFTGIEVHRPGWTPVARYVTFAADVRLDGPWAAGGLLARGFGRIMRDRNATEINAAA